MEREAPLSQPDSLRGCIDSIRQITAACTGESAQVLRDSFTQLERLTQAQAAREQALTEQLQAAERARVEAVERFHRVENELAKTVDAIPEVVVIYNARGLPIYANPAAQRMYGADLVGQNRRQIAVRLFVRDMGGNRVNFDRLPSSRALHGETVHDERYIFHNADGEDRIILASATPILNEAGQIDRAVVIWHDITQVEQLTGLARQSARETRQMLVQSEAVFNSLTDGVIVYRPDGFVQQANPYAIALLGFDPLRMPHERLEARLRWTDGQGTPLAPGQNAIERALQGETVLNQAMGLTNRVGRSYALQVSASPFYVGKDFTGVVVVLHDRTDRERLLEENQRQRALLERVIDAVPGGLALVTGPELTIQMVNRIHSMLTANPDVNLIGLPLAKIWSVPSQVDLPQKVREVMDSGEAQVIDHFAVTHADGRSFILRWHIYPIEWEAHSAALMVGWDLTALEAAHRQAALAAEEARQRAAEAEEGKRILDALMENIPEGITIADAPDVTIRRVSQYGKQMTGRPAEMLEGISMEAHPEQWQIYQLDGETLVPAEELPLSRATLKGEVSDNKELIMQRMNGEKIFILCNAAPIRDSQGAITGGLIAWRDVTAMKNAEQALSRYAQQLQRVNQELQDFAFIASHDLQEPLRKVKSFGDLLVKNYGDLLQDSGKEYIARMSDAVFRMQDMLDGLLSYSRISTQGNPLAQVDLNQVYREVCTDLEVRIQQTQGQLSVDPLPTITADPLQMRQLFQNLLSNALKFHRPGVPPVVKVWAETSAASSTGPAQVRLYVQDNGVGFEQEHAEKVFQPFVRLHGRSAFEGTGMGLPICEKIVKRHGGSIAAQSAPDEGATFIVVLPLAP